MTNTARKCAAKANKLFLIMAAKNRNNYINLTTMCETIIKAVREVLENASVFILIKQSSSF
jgi:hypothetical protein